jgi:hypothetical protein
MVVRGRKKENRENALVPIVAENIAALDPAQDAVVDGAGRIDAGLPGHGGKGRQSDWK